MCMLNLIDLTSSNLEGIFKGTLDLLQHFSIAII